MRLSFKSFAVLLGIVLLSGGCWPQKSGPEKIRYDREACEICRMIISDPRFAAQIRGGERQKIYKFDDVGDAVIWLEGKPWKNSPDTKIWVMSMRDGKTWLEAQKAWYLPGQVSPMDYGFGALAAREKGAISWDGMRKIIIARGLSSRCAAPEPSPGIAHDHDHDGISDHEGIDNHKESTKK